MSPSQMGWQLQLWASQTTPIRPLGMEETSPRHAVGGGRGVGCATPQDSWGTPAPAQDGQIASR